MQEIKLKNIDQVLYYDVLSNGLSVYMVVNKNVEDFHLSLTTRYGSIHTEFMINGKYYKVSNGIAHFLEHVNFNYKEGVTAHDLFQKLGSNINAYTTFDHTSYWVRSNNSFKKNLNLLLDFVQRGYFTEQIIEKEKGIIVEEIRRSSNDVRKKALYARYESVFVNDKRRFNILGTEADVKGITLDEVKLVHDNFYHPNNMFLVITGNFNPEEALSVIEDNQKEKGFSNNMVEIIQKVEPVKVAKRKIEIKDKQVEIPRYIMNYKMDINMFKDYDLELLENILYIILDNNIGYTSDLREYLEKNNLIASLSYDVEILEDVVVIAIFIYSDNGDKAMELIKRQIENLSINEIELERRRRVSIANLIYEYDFIRRVNSEIVYSLIKHNKVYDNLFELYNNVTLDEVKKVISLLNWKNESLVILKK